MMEDIQREENESEVDYFKRAILILQANINKLVIQNSENEERLKREAAENEERLKREAAEIEERLKREAAENE